MPNVAARSARSSLGVVVRGPIGGDVMARDRERVPDGELEVPIVTRRRELADHIAPGTTADRRAIRTGCIPPAPSVGVAGVDLHVRHPGVGGEPGPVVRVELVRT